MTASTRTLNLAIGPYLVDLYYVPGEFFHGFEATTANTTSGSGYYRTGGLVINMGELVDYDGVAVLPKCVGEALRGQGITVSDDCM